MVVLRYRHRGVGAGNEVAGLASDYVVVPPPSASAVISAANLIVTANNDAKIVTQSDTAGYNGVSFTGFVGGDNASMLGGTLSITRTGVGVDEAAGTYNGVLVASGYTSSNYNISYVNGNYQIVPAQDLLVHIQNMNNSYGTTPGYGVTSAQYMDSGNVIHTLTQTSHNGNTFTYNDSAGGSVTFTVTPTGAVLSGAGFLAAGNYGLTGSNTSIVGNNFLQATYVGNQAVERVALTPQANGVSKVYDGTTNITGLNLGLSGELSGDIVDVGGVGAFNTPHAGNNLGYTVNNIALSGADANNYYLSSNTLAGTDGIITPKAVTVTASTDTKVYDGTTASNVAVTNITGLLTGDNLSGVFQTYNSTHALGNDGSLLVVNHSGASVNGSYGSLLGDYAITYVNTAGTITPASVTVTASSDTKVFDGTTASNRTVTNITGLVSGDQLTGLTQSYNNAHVLGANGSTLLVDSSHANMTSGVGSALSDYVISYVDATGTITPKTVTVTASTDTKMYDGTTTSTVAVTNVTGLVGNDSLTNLFQAYNSSQALGANGSLLVVDGSNVGLSSGAGDRLSDYGITYVSTAGTITRRPVTVSNVSLNSDGSLNISQATLSGVLPGETLTLVPGGAPGTLALSGPTAGDYVLIVPRVTQPQPPFDDVKWRGALYAAQHMIGLLPPPWITVTQTDVSPVLMDVAQSGELPGQALYCVQGAVRVPDYVKALPVMGCSQMAPGHAGG